MATNNATSRTAGVAHLSTGSFTGDGTATVITLGFTARRIEVFNGTDTIMWVWNEGMAATTSVKTVAAGTMTTDATSAIVVSAANKTATLSAGLCVAAKAITYAAWG